MSNLIISSDIDAFLCSANKAAARSELGLGSAAVASSDSFDAAGSAAAVAAIKQPLSDILTSISGLSNSAGVLVNNGSGSFSYSTNYASLGSNTLTGLLSFSGTTHAGIRMNNLTTAQKGALTAAAGMIVFDTDLGRFQSYSGAAWVSHVRLTGDTMTGALAITAGSSAVSAPPLSVTQTWTGGAGVSYSGVKFSFTDTSSALSEEYFGVYGGAAGTTRIFSVEKIGGANIISLGKLASISNTFSIDNDVAGIALGSARQLSWSSTVNSYDTADVILKREAAGHLISRNGTTAQILSIANTWTSTTNFERFKIDWVGTSNVCRIGTSKGSGGGSTRAMHLEVGDSAAIKISTAGGIDFAMLATTTETIIPDKTITVSIAGVSVKIPCL